MKKYYFLSLILVIATFTGCGSIDDGSNSEHDSSQYEGSNDSSHSEHESNDDEHSSSFSSSSGNTNVSYHNQGKNCLSCHNFTSAGTVFTKLNAQNSDGTSYAGGYSIRLLLQYTNQTITYTQARGTANTYSKFNAGAVNSYTAQVVDAQGNVVNKSVENSHDLTRLACNSCHTSTGTSGAPGRIVSYDYYATVTTPAPAPVPTPTPTPTPSPSSISFENVVMPILTAKCQSCHGDRGNFTVTTASATYTNIQSFGGINTGSPTNSSLLLKGSAQVSHGGGSQISSTSTEYITIRDWIAAGASTSTLTPVPTPTPTPTPTSTPTISFANDVMPILTTSCKSCHGSSGNFSVTTASATYTNIQSFGGINTGTPTSSSLLLKGSGQVSHGGGSRISATSTGYATIRDWITAGASNN